MQTKSQYCKTKSQIKQKEYSGMTHHGLIFTGTTPIGNIRICSSSMVVGITTTYAISTYHHYSRYRYFWMITVLIWKKACINLFITYFNIELKRTKLASHPPIHPPPLPPPLPTHTHQTVSD